MTDEGLAAAIRDAFEKRYVPSPGLEDRVVSAIPRTTRRDRSTYVPRLAGAFAAALAILVVAVLLGPYALGVRSLLGRTSTSPTPQVASAARTPAKSATPIPFLCQSAAAPSGRMGAAGAYDQSRAALVIFGGIVKMDPSMASAADTWIQSGGCWSKAIPQASPGDRAYAVMAYDPGAQRVVLYGGQHDEPGFAPRFLTDTWSWDGTNWTQLAQGPSLFGAVGTFDMARGELLVFGTPLTGPPAQTWALKGNGWRRLQPTSSPTARGQESIAYDYATERVLLFGGWSQSQGYLNDTWSWDGTNWTRLQPLHSPSPRMGASMCWTSLGTVLFAGYPLIADTWLWGGSDWAAAPITDGPPGRSDATCASDSKGGRALFFGGANSSDVLSDLWSFDGVRWFRV
jgi:hypothetical protein